jgi:ATP-dependent helicase/nuclease subunit B
LLELAPQLQAALSAGQTLIVPTAQRAAALRLGFATQQLAHGHRAFRTPDVQSLSGWLHGQPVRGAPHAPPLRRLGVSEEWLMWREAVAAAAAKLSLPAAGHVDAVREAAALLFEWRIAPAALLQSGTPEAALLSESLTAIDTRLTELGASGSWRMLQDLAEDPPRRAPLFAGFAYRTPAQRALLEAWAQRSTAVPDIDSAFAAAPAAVAHAGDPAEELAMIAQWCRERLAATPTARLLVIVPDLARRQSEVRRVFDEALDPNYLAHSAGGAPGYALEGGQPLLNYAPIAAGLRTLRLLDGEVELAEISQWLRDDCGSPPNAARRALLDVWLRSVVPPRLNAPRLLQALRAAPPGLLADADGVAAEVARMLKALGVGPRAALGVWSGRFARVLSICGLDAGAARQRGSHAQQILQRLDELLREWAALSPALGMFSAGEALDLFTQSLARTRFEPATGDAPVTLSASLADPIVRYDGIWVSGLHAGAIPQQARFDPFIPAALQRRAGVLAADAAALVAQARLALRTLCRSSREFILSAPAHAADQELAASPLLAPYAAQSRFTRQLSRASLPRAIRESRRVEHYRDEPGAPWPDGVPLPAGVRAIELQSLCPFRAYAQLRLGAEPLEVPVPGITSRERGRALHRALELLWRRLGGSAGLGAARAEGSLPRLIHDSVAQAADEILRGTDPDAAEADRHSAAADATGLLQLRRAAITRELGRAARLIGALCEVEAGRTPFVIHELEASHRVQIAGAQLNVRIDRIDRLDDATHAILDYKSSAAVTPDWEGTRTTQPQLLVYLLAAGVPVSALAIAHLAPGSVQFKGIGDVDSRLPGIKGVAAFQQPASAGNPWEQQREVWLAQVTQLAGDFVGGRADVDPADRACDFCHLHAFCRIGDTEATAADAVQS